MDTLAQPQRPRKRARARARAADVGNTPNPVATVGWGSPIPGTHTVQVRPQTVRGTHGDTVEGQPPTFSPQQLDTRSHHQVPEPDGLMTAYSASQHSQYPDPPSLDSTAQPDTSGLDNLSGLAGDGSGAAHQQQHPHPHQIQQHQVQQHQVQQHQQQQQQHHPQQQQQHHPQQQQQQQQQRPSAATANKTDRAIFPQYGANHTENDSSPVSVANSAAVSGYNIQGWAVAGSVPPPSPMPPPPMPPQSPAPGLAPPPEGIYRTFEDLLSSVQRVAKDQGYGVVKLRASNYRDGKPTRYDLVCDRGGVKYASTAKKRNPSTRKIDCPWRAKAVCEVNLDNQWRFAMQEGRHNHEARVPTVPPGQENSPTAQSIRHMSHKIDRMHLEMTNSFNLMRDVLAVRLKGMEERLVALEGGNSVPPVGAPMPTANMGGASMGNGGMGVVDVTRMSSIDQRVSAIEQQRNNGMDSLPMLDDDDSGRLAMMVNS